MQNARLTHSDSEELLKASTWKVLELHHGSFYDTVQPQRLPFNTSVEKLYISEPYSKEDIEILFKVIPRFKSLKSFKIFADTILDNVLKLPPSGLQHIFVKDLKIEKVEDIIHHLEEFLDKFPNLQRLQIQGKPENVFSFFIDLTNPSEKKIMLEGVESCTPTAQKLLEALAHKHKFKVIFRSCSFIGHQDSEELKKRYPFPPEIFEPLEIFKKKYKDEVTDNVRSRLKEGKLGPRNQPDLKEALQKNLGYLFDEEEKEEKISKWEGKAPCWLEGVNMREIFCPQEIEGRIKDVAETVIPFSL